MSASMPSAAATLITSSMAANIARWSRRTASAPWVFA